VKGLEVLQKAEVVVYDKLVGVELLNRIPAEAKKIDVGKRANNHPVPQEEINRILLREALDGKEVVRLKGGDPFLFGRGGEELELLVKHHIPFEIIPGIPSAISVPPMPESLLPTAIFAPRFISLPDIKKTGKT
jgi:uroporphyrinogen III methyltransferase/synthase